MARRNATDETSESRRRAHQALTRGRRDTPAAEAKLKGWGEVEGQAELLTRQDLRTDQQTQG